MTGVRQAARGEARFSKLKRLVVQGFTVRRDWRESLPRLEPSLSFSRPFVVGLLTTSLCEFIFSIHDVEAIVEVYSVARSVSLHSSAAFGAFGSGELLLFADRQWIFGCPVVKPLWRRESLTFVVALACFENSASPFSSSLPTWYVADFCRFPTVCCHSVKLMSPVRLAVVDSPGVGSVCMFQLKVVQSFSL
ncbi:hypothetical protein HID58_065621, partial [Brassica napus]